LNGCSQLGIATTNDLSDLENRLQNSSNATDTRVENLEKNTADLQKTLEQLSVSIDTLNTRFARAKKWLETMNIDTIASEAKEASGAALNVEKRTKLFYTNYLESIKAQKSLLEQQIQILEQQMGGNDKSATKPTDPGDKSTTQKPADSGG
jgi:hypothetical protein